MKKFLIAAVLMGYLPAFAQDETVKKLQADASREIKKEQDSSVWRKGGMFNINLAQGSLNNWAAGGDNFSLSLNTILSLYGFYKKRQT